MSTDPDVMEDPALSQQQRDAAGYTQGRTQFEPRCSTCVKCTASRALHGGKQHGRHCSLWNTPVKTHGGCNVHVPVIGVR